MENFYVSIEETFRVIGGDGIIDRDVHIYGKDLVADRPISLMALAKRDKIPLNNYFRVDLEFNPKILRSNERTIILISDENMLYLLDRYTAELEDLGQIDNPVRDVLITDNDMYILTTKELLHYNSYFEPVNSVEISTIIEDMNEGDLICFYKDNKKYNKDLKFKIILLEDSIAVVYNHIYIFSSELKFINKHPLEIQGATFMKKYNKFACIKGDQIVFIESNGLEHGDPLVTPGFYSTTIEQMYIGDEALLVLGDGKSIRVYYLKNLNWYKKMEIPGKFHSVYDESICIYDTGYTGITIEPTDDATVNLMHEDKNNMQKFYSYSRLYINKSINTFYFIDGNTLKYTNVYQSKTLPTFFNKEIVLENTIKSVFYKDNLLFIYVDNTINCAGSINSNSENLKYKKKFGNLKNSLKLNCSDMQASADRSITQEYKDNALYIYEASNATFQFYKKCDIRNG
ncbi:hypothetical protein ENBRE01_2025 [Enteropsectra breve]|nr:hypothetical protein ENBRE01_2025 [Enteropsectra breve]